MRLSGDSAKIAEIFDVAIETVLGATQSLTQSVVAAAQRRAEIGLRMATDHLPARCWRLQEAMLVHGDLSDPWKTSMDYSTMSAERMLAAGRNAVGNDPVIVYGGPIRNGPKLDLLRTRLKSASARALPLAG